MNLWRAREVDHVYSGTSMKLGPGWIPDFVEATINPTLRQARITLIELEATEAAARASCRKYLPEDSAAVLQAFLGYLDTVLAQCRASADPRFKAFQELKDFLSKRVNVAIFTAGALRTSADLLEKFALIDQPGQPTAQAPPASPAARGLRFQGSLQLSRVEADGLLRTVRILHHVVVGRDHSGGTLKSWRNIRRKPLDDAVSAEPGDYAEMHKLLSAKRQRAFGLRIDCDRLGTELTNLWASSGKRAVTHDDVVNWVTSFFPTALGFPEHEQMQNVFEKARAVIVGTAT